MRVLIAFIALLLYPVASHSNLTSTKLTGYLEFSSDVNYWETTASERWLLTIFSTPENIELFEQPINNLPPTLVVEDIYGLHLTDFTYSISPSVNVYGVRPGWVRVKTVDSQLLWTRLEEPKNYLSLHDVIQAEWYIEIDPVEFFRAGRNQEPPIPKKHIPHILEHSFSLRGFRYISDELWLQLERSIQGTRVENWLEDITLSGSQEFIWIKAHSANGELAFEFINPC